MFQSSDDDDLNVEDLLNVPQEKSIFKNEDSPKSSTKLDDFNTILDDFDDNELILSVIDNVDNSIINEPVKQSFGNGHQKIINIIKKTLQTNTPIETRTATPTKTSIQSTSSIDKYVANDIKHKLPTPEVTKSSRVEYERKFPGPAGLIPKKSKQNTPVKTEVHIDGSPPQVEASRTDDILESSCWDQLLKDAKSLSSELQLILDENTVASVKRMNIICSKPRKLQFFAAIIMQMDCSVCDPSIILKDSTGEIHGTLHKDLWENHSNLLTVGTALLLKQVSVLSITNTRKLYVNVTSNNIVTTYTPQSDRRPVLVTQLATISDEDFVQRVKKKKLVVFEETHPNKIMNNTLPKRSSWVKEVPTHKSHVLPASNQKADTTKIIRHENKVPSSTIFEPKTNQYSSSLIAQSKELDEKPLPPHLNSSQIQFKDLISNELEGIDVDSLFGEF